jgi:hypothetical protein
MNYKFTIDYQYRAEIMILHGKLLQEKGMNIGRELDILYIAQSRMK